eukprot:1292971-Prymnesium_polylepis.1
MYNLSPDIDNVMIVCASKGAFQRGIECLGWAHAHQWARPARDATAKGRAAMQSAPEPSRCRPRGARAHGLEHRAPMSARAS